MAGAQHRFLADCWILVTANRDVELSFAINPPQAVVAGLVEVDEARGDLDAVVKLMLAADVVVVIFRVILGVLS